MITAERLRQLLTYDPVTGAFMRGDQLAGGLDRQGYWRIKIDGRDYAAHRLAWLYMTGKWPSRSVSFRNDNRADVRWRNLRLASPKQTAQRRKARNKLGIKGVRITPRGNYRARIRVNGRDLNLGTFATEDEAGEVYAAAARQHFGEFARAG